MVAKLVEFQKAEICTSRLCEGPAQRSIRICTATIQGVREREAEQIGVSVGQFSSGSCFSEGPSYRFHCCTNSAFLCGPNNNKIN